MSNVFEGQPDGRQSGDVAMPVSRFRPRYRALTDDEKALHDAIKAKAAELEALFDTAYRRACPPIALEPLPARGAALNSPPDLIDPAALIYQFSDFPASIAALYEGGRETGIAYAGDVTDLYAGSTPPGHYRTDLARGRFQLGSTPAGAITCDTLMASMEMTLGEAIACDVFKSDPKQDYFAEGLRSLELAVMWSIKGLTA